MSFMQLTKLYLRGMMRRDEGRILQVGSLFGFSPSPLLAVYAATKAFQTSLTDAIINEIKDSPVTMTLLVPGFTNTGTRGQALAIVIKSSSTTCTVDYSSLLNRLVLSVQSISQMSNISVP